MDHLLEPGVSRETGPPGRWDGRTLTFDKTLDQTRDVAAAAREQFTVLKERELSGVKAEFQCTQGLPTHEIVCRAESLGADLVLISTHGRSGAKRVLLGSVAEEVVRSPPCSVLVVPERRVLGALP